MLFAVFSLRKTEESVSPILVTLTSRSDSNFERSNIRLKENKRDAIDFNSYGLDYCVRKNEGKNLWFSADCVSAKYGVSLFKILISNFSFFFLVPRRTTKKVSYDILLASDKRQKHVIDYYSGF